MSQLKNIPLEAKDIKLLKRRKLFQLILLIYLGVLTFIIIVLSAYLIYTSSEQKMGLLSGAIGLIMIFVTRSIYTFWMKLKTDLQTGFKSVVQGVITDKYSHKNTFQLTIEKEKYQVDRKHYFVFNVEQSVLIGFSPLSKIILDIREIV